MIFAVRDGEAGGGEEGGGVDGAAVDDLRKKFV